MILLALGFAPLIAYVASTLFYRRRVFAMYVISGALAYALTQSPTGTVFLGAGIGGLAVVYDTITGWVSQSLGEPEIGSVEMD